MISNHGPCLRVSESDSENVSLSRQRTAEFKCGVVLTSNR